MAVRAVLLGGRHVGAENIGDLAPAAVRFENIGEQRRQLIEAEKSSVIGHHRPAPGHVSDTL